MNDALGSLSSFLDDTFPEFIEFLIFGAVFILIERIRPAEKAKVFKNDMASEFLLAVTNLFIFIPLIGIVSYLFAEMVLKPTITEQFFAPQIEALPIAIQVLLGALLLDLSTYWRHRFTHAYMWPYHAIHHSATQIQWITGLRLHPIELLVATLFSSFLLHIFGFSGIGFIGAIIFIKVMNYFTHVNLRLKFGKPLRYLIASPHYHRWHHATDKKAYDKNFCGAFPFLDMAFGTYYHPEELPPGYGLSPQEQRNYPENSFAGWLLYPIKKHIKKWQK